MLESSKHVRGIHIIIRKSSDINIYKLFAKSISSKRTNKNLSSTEIEKYFKCGIPVIFKLRENWKSELSTKDKTIIDSEDIIDKPEGNEKEEIAHDYYITDYDDTVGYEVIDSIYHATLKNVRMVRHDDNTISFGYLTSDKKNKYADIAALFPLYEGLKAEFPDCKILMQ